jgi:hypothetical protein
VTFDADHTNYGEGTSARIDFETAFKLTMKATLNAQIRCRAHWQCAL